MKSKPNYRIYCKISTIPKSGLNIIAFYPSNYLGTNPQLNSNFLRTTIVLSKDANSSIASFTIMKELKKPFMWKIKKIFYFSSSICLESLMYSVIYLHFAKFYKICGKGNFFPPSKLLKFFKTYAYGFMEYWFPAIHHLFA